MSAKSSIEWTDATEIVDRGGRRTRIYKRKSAIGPGMKLRREMASIGKRWCRGCKLWLSFDTVGTRGVCKTHANAEYRSNYANAGGSGIRARVYGRKRRTESIGRETREFVMDSSCGDCVYCGIAAGTLDHIEPVVLGGLSRRGNLVAACASCNSSKKAKSLDEFLKLAVAPNIDSIVREIIMAEVL